MGKKEFVYQTEVSPQEAAARLEELAASLRQGRVCLQKGEDSAVLEPDYTVSLEIGGGARKDKVKLWVNLSWRLEEETRPRREELWIGSSLPDGDRDKGPSECEPDGET